MKLKLSVLDQSPIHDGGTPAQGLHDSIHLAVNCDALGFHRYWLAEHHDLCGYAGTCPEIMVAHVAQATRRIRVGSGGVMLNHYAPFKVAETFRMLEALHPGRIDLGVGRAPGGDATARHALAWPEQPMNPDLYAQQVYDLSRFLHGTLPPGHPYAKLTAVPETATPPALWLLGSDGGSAEFAGQMGAGFALALFIGSHARSAAIFKEYRHAFQPSPSRARPETALAIAVICAADYEQAYRIAATAAYWRLQVFRHNQLVPQLSPDECLARRDALSAADREYFDSQIAGMILGDGSACRQQVEALAQYYDVEEVMAVTVCYEFSARLESYRLLARAFDLPAEYVTGS